MNALRLVSASRRAAALWKITPSHIRHYERDGVAVLRAAFDQDWIKFAREAVDEAMESPGPFGEEFAIDGQGELAAAK